MIDKLNADAQLEDKEAMRLAKVYDWLSDQGYTPEDVREDENGEAYVQEGDDGEVFGRLYLSEINLD